MKEELNLKNAIISIIHKRHDLAHLENDIMTMRTIEEQNVAHEIAAECIDLIEDINEKVLILRVIF